MHIAFAVVFFFLVGLSETFRQGVFGLSPSESSVIIYGMLICGAVAILRGDLIYVLRRPSHPLYGDGRANWTWPRTVLGLALGPALCAIALAYGHVETRIEMHPVASATLMETLVSQVAMITLAENLFFREAAIKAFGGNLLALFLAATLACFIFYLPGGVPEAMIAAGSALFYTALRLIGTNILAVILVHAATVVTLGAVVSPVVPSQEIWTYAIYFTVAAALVSFTALALFTPNGRELRYA